MTCETQTIFLPELKDFKEDRELMHFSGTAIYRKKVRLKKSDNLLLNLGKVHGIAELFVNGKPVGVKWYGRRIFDISNVIVDGENEIEVRVTTIMGNYLKTLKDNVVAQYWVNRPGREQEIQSMGMVGPVEIYNN